MCEQTTGDKSEVAKTYWILKAQNWLFIISQITLSLAMVGFKDPKDQKKEKIQKK